MVGHDHIGHGSSLADGAERLYFGPKGSWNWVVQDIYTLRQQAGKKFVGLPYFLLGHSMGSFLARTYLIRYPGTVDGAILMGTGQMAPALIAGGKAVAIAEGKRLGEDQPSPVVTKLSFGTYNKLFAPNRTGFDWLSVNEENVDAYIADPLCGGNASIGLFREMLGGMSYIAKPAGKLFPCRESEGSALRRAQEQAGLCLCLCIRLPDLRRKPQSRSVSCRSVPL